MFGPLNFTAESLAQEARNTQAKLQAGLVTLQ